MQTYSLYRRIVYADVICAETMSHGDYLRVLFWICLCRVEFHTPSTCICLSTGPWAIYSRLWCALRKGWWWHMS